MLSRKGIYTGKWKLVCPACDQIDRDDRVDFKLKKKKERKKLQFVFDVAGFSNADAEV